MLSSLLAPSCRLSRGGGKDPRHKNSNSRCRSQRRAAASLTRRRSEEKSKWASSATAVVLAASTSSSSSSSSSSSPWLCPTCAAPLSPSDDLKTLSCAQRHCFDVAKEGYVNLVRAGRKARKTGAAPAGDAPEALAARGRFFAAGHFDRVMDAAADAVMEVLRRGGDAATTTTTTVLDAGCGEGSYLRRLARRLAASPSTPSPSSTSSAFSPSSSIHLLGVDVAKAAVRSAAARAQREERENEERRIRSHFAVASAFALPLAAASASCALVAFAPLPSAELRRVLRQGEEEGGPSSAVVVVGPGPEHFLGLKRAVYGPEGHGPQASLRGAEERTRGPCRGPRQPRRARRRRRQTEQERKMTDSSGSGDSGGGGPEGAEGLSLLSSPALPPFSSQARVRYRLSLDGASAFDLLLMTPYWWKASEETREELKREGLETEVDVLISTVEREDLDLL